MHKSLRKQHDSPCKYFQTVAPNGASIQKATVMYPVRPHQTTAAVTKPSGCSLRCRSCCTLKSPCPTIPLRSPTHLHPTRTSKTDTCITKQSDALERRKTALTMLYPGTQKNAASLPCTHWHTHTHAHYTHEARESVGGEKEVEWDSMQKRRMSKNHWDLNL